MSQLNLLLLHVKPQARAENDFDLQLTANISLYSLPLGSPYYEELTIVRKIIFVFSKTKICQNLTSVFF